MPVLVGTSGWYYKDWDGPVYPQGVKEKDRLPYYASRFPTVEVNVTYYRDPSPATVKGWIEKVRDVRNFEFTIKAPKPLTQDALAKGTVADAVGAARAWVNRVAEPLRAADKLGALFLQLSPGVLHNARTLERLDATLRELARFDVAVEFRNKTWLAEDGAAFRDDARALMDAHGAALVVVDGPSFPVVVAGEAKHAYVRFHGRNEDVWFRGRGAVDDNPDEPRMNRYDYSYGEKELQPWATELKKMAEKKQRVRVYYNNHPEGQAWNDAGTMVDLLARAHVSVVEPAGAQRRLL